MKYKTVLWDFNGTIVNDVDLGILAVNKMLKKRNLPTLDSVEQYRRVFRFPVKEYYRLIGFDFQKESFEELAVEWVENYTAGEHMLRLNEGFLDIWQYLKNTGVQQMILSSSESAMLKRQLSLLEIDGKFDRILGTDNIYAGGKIEMAKRCLGTEVSHAVLIGDTIHDADTAAAIGADCILFSGGHSAEETLLAAGASIVSHLSELTHYL